MPSLREGPSSSSVELARLRFIVRAWGRGEERTRGQSDSPALGLFGWPKKALSLDTRRWLHLSEVVLPLSYIIYIPHGWFVRVVCAKNRRCRLTAARAPLPARCVCWFFIHGGRCAVVGEAERRRRGDHTDRPAWGGEAHSYMYGYRYRCVTYRHPM